MSNMFSAYLQIHHGICSRNWSSSVITNAVMADKYFSQNKEACRRACVNVIKELSFSADVERTVSDVVLDYVGNKDLLYADNKVSLICHRADESFFARQAQAVLDAARHGNIVVSAFVSKKEREVMRMLMQESLPIIEIMGKGFCLQYHPNGGSYDACVAGKLVQISPWDSSMQYDCKLIREKCLVMNELVRVISKTSDDWWKL